MFKKYVDDILVVTGCGLVLLGFWQVLPAAVPFVAGLMCIAGGILVGLAERGKP